MCLHTWIQSNVITYHQPWVMIQLQQETSHSMLFQITVQPNTHYSSLPWGTCNRWSAVKLWPWWQPRCSPTGCSTAWGCMAQAAGICPHLARGIQRHWQGSQVKICSPGWHQLGIQWPVWPRRKMTRNSALQYPTMIWKSKLKLVRELGCHPHHTHLCNIPNFPAGLFFLTS